MKKNKSSRKAHAYDKGKLYFFDKCNQYQYKKKRFKDLYSNNKYGEQVKGE